MGNSTKKWGLISSLIVVSIILIVAIVYQFKEKPPNEVVKTPTIKEENDIEPQTKKVAESEIESIKETQSKEKETVIDIKESTEEQTEVQTQEERKEVNTKVNNEIQTIKQKQVENQTPTEMSNKKQVGTVTEVSKEIIEEQTESTTEQQVETQAEEQTESTTEQQVETQTEVPTKDPEQTESKPKQNNNSPKHGDTNDKGQIYVDGFGWIDQGGENIENIGDSDGDINKQVGIME